MIPTRTRCEFTSTLAERKTPSSAATVNRVKLPVGNTFMYTIKDPPSFRRPASNGFVDPETSTYAFGPTIRTTAPGGMRSGHARAPAGGSSAHTRLRMLRGIHWCTGPFGEDAHDTGTSAGLEMAA